MEVKVLTQKTKTSRNQVSAGFVSTFYSVNERLSYVIEDSYHYKSVGSKISMAVSIFKLITFWFE